MITNTSHILDDAARRFLKAFQHNRGVPWAPFIRGEVRIARNLVTRFAYQEINTFLLAFEPFDSCFWATPAQLADQGLTIPENAKAALASLPLYGPEGTSALGAYPVFNTDQIPGAKPPPLYYSSKPYRELDEACHHFARDIQPLPTYQVRPRTPPSYNVETDTILIDLPENYPNATVYYGACLSLLLQATRHPDRLNRVYPQPLMPGPEELLIIDLAMALFAALYRLPDYRGNRYPRDLATSARLPIVPSPTPGAHREYRRRGPGRNRSPARHAAPETQPPALPEMAQAGPASHPSNKPARIHRHYDVGLSRPQRSDPHDLMALAPH